MCHPTILWLVLTSPLNASLHSSSISPSPCPHRKCKEVKCKNINFKDGYGQTLERSSACFDPSASLVVTITDTCPCHYPGNYASNKRWCCGDMYHLDISHWAYEKLADPKLGVIALEWRDVPCWYRPSKPAKNPWGQRSGPDRGKPNNWHPSMDKRPYKKIDWNLPKVSGRRL
jgi:Lytic transglycolase